MRRHRGLLSSLVRFLRFHTLCDIVDDAGINDDSAALVLLLYVGPWCLLRLVVEEIEVELDSLTSIIIAVVVDSSGDALRPTRDSGQERTSVGWRAWWQEKHNRFVA